MIARPLTVAFAHPVSGATPADVAANIARAHVWLRWLIDHEPDVAFNAAWLPLVNVLDDFNPAHRKRGLRDSCAIAAGCDGIVLCGGITSPGMLEEVASVRQPAKRRDIEWVTSRGVIGPGLRVNPTGVPAERFVSTQPGEVYDLTALGAMPPLWPLPLAQRRYDAIGLTITRPLAWGRDVWLEAVGA